MQFEFATAQRIVFGRGKLQQLGPIAASLGSRALLVHAPHLARSGTLGRVRALLAESGVEVERYAVHGEPQASVVDEAAEVARTCALVIGIGGGSVLDVGKAAAGLATNGGPVRDYLEGVGTGRELTRPALPFIAVPTTAGTGSEVTRNAVVSSKEEGFKKSIRSVLLLPAVALVDPALTDSLPRAQTVASGLDALTQLVEPYVSLRANVVTDALALRGMKLAFRALPRAVHDPADARARDEMALASLLGGLCLANAGLGAVHGIAAALGARFDLPHGLACASVLVPAMEANLRALETREPDNPVLARYATVGETLSGLAFASPVEARRAAVDALRGLVRELSVPTLGSLGVTGPDVPQLVAESRGSSMKANPIVLHDEDIASVLRAAL